MLVKQAEAVEQQIQDLKEARDNEKRRDEFAQREAMLAELAKDLKPLARKMTVLASNDVKVAYDGSLLQTAIDEVVHVRERFKDEAQWIIRSTNDLSDLKGWIAKHRKKIRRKIQSAWMDHYQQRVPDLSQDLLEVMGQIEGFQKPVQTIRRCNASLISFKEEAPTTQDQYDTFKTLVEKRTSTWDEIGSEDLSEDVVSFLREAGKEGARADQFTASVRDWLDENDLLSRVRIQLKQ